MKALMWTIDAPWEELIQRYTLHTCLAGILALSYMQKETHKQTNKHTYIHTNTPNYVSNLNLD